jgi:hypothetical protein
MIDYRPIIAQYIKDTLNITNVKDGILTFKQPSGDYAIYYILDEDIQSLVNNTSSTVNAGDDTILDEKYDPLTVVTMQIDVRGGNSFLNSRNLNKSFDTISNKKLLSDQGVSFMNVTGVTPLPQLKNTKQEEGYIFDLTFSFDNSFIEQSLLAETATIDGKLN